MKEKRNTGMDSDKIIEVRKKQMEYRDKCNLYYQACIDKDAPVIHSLRKSGFNPSALKDLRSGEYTRFHNESWAKKQLGLSNVLSILDNVLIPDLTNIVLDYCKNSKGELTFEPPSPPPPSPRPSLATYPLWHHSRRSESESSENESGYESDPDALKPSAPPMEEEEEEEERDKSDELSEDGRISPEPSAPAFEVEEEKNEKKKKCKIQ